MQKLMALGLILGLILVVGCGGGPEPPKLSERLQSVAKSADVIVLDKKASKAKISYRLQLSEHRFRDLSREDFDQLFKYFEATLEDLGDYDRYFLTFASVTEADGWAKASREKGQETEYEYQVAHLE